MSDINFLAVVVAAVAAFVFSSVWYIVFGEERMKQLRSGTNVITDVEENILPWKLLGEFVRSLVVGSVLAYLIVQLDVADWMDAIRLGFLVWIGLPAVLLAGSVMWENVPWKLAAIHAGDWLVKLLLMAAILGVWR
jgi:hypothetical protein